MPREDPEAALARISAWEKANPDLARTYPATQILSGAREIVDRYR